MKLDLAPFERRVEKKLIRKQLKGDLISYNYTEACAWDKAWDKYTRMARGLIVAKDGRIVARPFEKFHNLGEVTKTELKNLPRYQPEVMEKLDGSLGILYHDGKNYAVATRGSFESDQAIWATNWIRTHGRFPREYLQNHTYLFEIIYPENRIVVDYGKRAELVLIGIVYNWTGKVMPYKKVKEEAERLGFSYAKQFSLTLEEIQKVVEDSPSGIENEGYVLFYPEENLQVKIKLKDYVRLHRLITGISVKSIWENMMYGQKPREIFADAPDEVMDWIMEWTNKFNDAADKLIIEARKHYHKIKDMELRRDQALYLQKECPQLLSTIFMMVDGKPYRESIFKMIRPNKDDSIKSFKVIPGSEYGE